MAEIVIVNPGMPCAEHTLEHYSLGGSETAALMMAKELKKRGHLITFFANLPRPDRADHVPNGHMGEDGVRYVDINQAGPFLANTECDLLVVSRDPRLFQVPHQAKKAVLWMHDLATHNYTGPMLHPIAYNFNEIWCVSEFHRQQIHDVTGYPIERIKSVRNGIVDFQVLLPRSPEPNSLLYSARPERGLENLVMPGGIMERLPDWKLYVTMYENFPEHMREYYAWLHQRCEELPNVINLGVMSSQELRHFMNNVSAYVYPTSFEEVSCILARECMEQGLPFLTTKVGALPETLGDYGDFYDGPMEGEAFLQGFADFIKSVNLVENRVIPPKEYLYWEYVDWEQHLQPEKVKPFSMMWSLMEDSDIIPALAYYYAIKKNESISLEDHDGLNWLYNQLEEYYPALFKRETWAEYYERYYSESEDKKDNSRADPVGNHRITDEGRYRSILDEVKKLPQGATILDYGCAEGVISLNLARDCPDKNFILVDFAESNIKKAQGYAEKHGITNVEYHVWDIVSDSIMPTREADLVIVSEVLEHVEEPWKVAGDLERHVKVGGRVVITVPHGPWEASGLRVLSQWPWRAHIWHIDKWMLRNMFADKKNCRMTSLPTGQDQYGRSWGHLFYTYEVDHEPPHKIDPLQKAMQHHPRQTLALCMIAQNDEDEILKALNSVNMAVQQVIIALGPSHDNTEKLIHDWASRHPWIYTLVHSVPAIKPYEFGFDDARNASIDPAFTDWVLWMDTDEYLSYQEHLPKYLRDNAFESYSIHQHHFTTEPRGEGAMLDKPSRIFRNTGIFKFFGRVHEHAEKGFNGGPGFSFLMGDVDIAHTGYVNEKVRRGRFGRNFPLLEWDQQSYPDRKLGLFLWLRDIVHWMRYAVEVGNRHEALKRAQEAIEFYDANHEKWQGVGNSGPQALAYRSEAMAILGKGQEMRAMVGFDEKTGQEFVGRFNDPEDFLEQLRPFLEDQFKKRGSKYYQ